MTTRKALNGKTDAGSPHVRFDEGAGAPAKPRRGSLLYKRKSYLALTIKAVAAALCVVSVCAHGADLQQAEFHVSPKGDDSADGSRERPFATVARARDAVRALKKSGASPKGGVNVWLHGGEYPMREPLALGKEDSGVAGAPVAYRAWKGERPVFTGAWTVPSSAWRLADDPRIPAEAKGKVWMADVKSLGYDALEPDAPCGFHTPRPEFRIRALTRDGKRLTLACHPNTGFLRIGTVVDKAGVFKADLGDMTRWSRTNAPGLEALGYWRYLWADQTLPVCVDPAAGTISFALDGADSGTSADTSFHLSETSAAAAKAVRLYSFFLVKGMPFYLQNALAALDAPDEWYLDRKAGLLYVYSEEGKNTPPKGRYELSLAVKSLVSAKDVAHIRFEGITFRGGRHHGVEMRGVSDVKIERCDFRNFGGHGLLLDRARDSLVRGCSFRTFGHCAMTLDGGDRKTLTPSGVTIESCDFSDTGLAMRTYTPGIWMTGCGHRIVRNDFHDLPSSAVRIIGNEHLFASNLVERVVQESDDQGAVDMWGDPTYRGNRFIHNIFRDVGRGGAFVRCGQGGIRFDDSISGNLVYGNRFDNCSKANFGGVQIHGGRDNVVRNNVFTRCHYGITVSPWPQAHWRNFLSGARGKTSREAANVDGAAFKAKYPEFASALDTPMRNTFECNVFEGDAKSFTLRAPNTTVMRGNVCVPKLPADLSSIPGFDPLPPESAIGAAGVPCGNVALREVVRGPDARAVSITTNAAGHAVLDFGKHQFGWLEVDVKKPGPYKIVWGELLDEKGSVQTGRRYTRSEGRIRCATTEGVFDGTGMRRIPYTTGNGNAYFMGNRKLKKELPGFGMVMPFRWAEIVELPFPVAADTVRQVPIYYPYDMAESRFDSDNDALNRVYGFCKHSIRATTFTGLFIDGDRERWPYEADSYITQLSTYAMTSDYSLARKMVDHLRDNSTWPTEWKQFFIRMCHADWMYTGRPDRIAAHYEAMKTQKLWLNLAREDGLLVTGTKEAEARGARDIVDWAKCYRDGFEFRPVNAVVNALHYRNLVEMGEMAVAIGKQDDARAFAERARKVRASFIKAFVDPASGLVRDGEGSKHLTVHANAMAIACGVLSGREASAPADFIVKKGMRCSTYMSQFVLEALFMAGRSDEAFKLMTTDGPRGWMQMMKLGATVSMEFWDLTLKEGGRVPDMNHAWSTAPLNVTVRHLLGVTPLKPGFEEIRFAPQFGPLTRLSAAVPTARGAFTIDARREGGRWTVDLVTPAPVRVVSDGGERSLPAGSHRVHFAGK